MHNLRASFSHSFIFSQSIGVAQGKMSCSVISEAGFGPEYGVRCSGRLHSSSDSVHDEHGCTTVLYFTTALHPRRCSRWQRRHELRSFRASLFFLFASLTFSRACLCSAVSLAYTHLLVNKKRWNASLSRGKSGEAPTGKNSAERCTYPTYCIKSWSWHGCCFRYHQTPLGDSS
jgi:hypothetical protein